MEASRPRPVESNAEDLLGRVPERTKAEEGKVVGWEGVLQDPNVPLVDLAGEERRRVAEELQGRGEGLLLEQLGELRRRQLDRHQD